MKNEILDEVWRNRDNFAKKHNYDLGKMMATLHEMELGEGVAMKEKPVRRMISHKKKAVGGKRHMSLSSAIR